MESAHDVVLKAIQNGSLTQSRELSNRLLENHKLLKLKNVLTKGIKQSIKAVFLKNGKILTFVLDNIAINAELMGYKSYIKASIEDLRSAYLSDPKLYAHLAEIFEILPKDFEISSYVPQRYLKNLKDQESTFTLTYSEAADENFLNFCEDEAMYAIVENIRVAIKRRKKIDEEYKRELIAQRERENSMSNTAFQKYMRKK